MFSFQFASSSTEVKLLMTLKGEHLPNLFVGWVPGNNIINYTFLNISIQVAKIFLNICWKPLLLIKKKLVWICFPKVIKSSAKPLLRLLFSPHFQSSFHCQKSLKPFRRWIQTLMQPVLAPGAGVKKIIKLIIIIYPKAQNKSVSSVKFPCALHLQVSHFHSPVMTLLDCHPLVLEDSYCSRVRAIWELDAMWTAAKKSKLWMKEICSPFTTPLILILALHSAVSDFHLS